MLAQQGGTVAFGGGGGVLTLSPAVGQHAEGQNRIKPYELDLYSAAGPEAWAVLCASNISEFPPKNDAFEICLCSFLSVFKRSKEGKGCPEFSRVAPGQWGSGWDWRVCVLEHQR